MISQACFGVQVNYTCTPCNSKSESMKVALLLIAHATSGLLAYLKLLDALGVL